MRIIGPDEIVFGVDDLDACRAFLTDYGLDETAWTDGKGGTFSALDATCVSVWKRDDADLPAALPSGNTLRQTVYGVESANVIDEIEAELSTDREVTRHPDGSITCDDDCGFALKFQVTKRIKTDLEPERVNSPGAEPARLENQLGTTQDAACKPRTLSHIVYFSPDIKKHEAFYMDRLKFVLTDRFTNVGPFLRPQACRDHHTMFLLDTPPHMAGLEHIAFHMQGPTELMLAGSRMIQKGWESFWGPGRHVFGSNWFWYFNCPLMTHFEFDADMDLHDDDWEPRFVEAGPQTAQVFLFENTEKWFPGAPGD